MISLFQTLTQKFQLLRFGSVGVTAMCVHMLSVLVIVPFGIAPLIANVIGFLIAFQVSYFGHARWTFDVQDPKNIQHKLKFFGVALISFLINELAYSILLKVFEMDYRIALAIVLVSVAILTFFMSRFWAFRE